MRSNIISRLKGVSLCEYLNVLYLLESLYLILIFLDRLFPHDHLLLVFLQLVLLIVQLDSQTCLLSLKFQASREFEERINQKIHQLFAFEGELQLLSTAHQGWADR